MSVKGVAREKQEAALHGFLTAIRRHKVPSSAFRVFDYPPPAFTQLAQTPFGQFSREVFLEKLDGALPRKFGFLLIVAAGGVIVETVVRLRIHMHHAVRPGRL